VVQPGCSQVRPADGREDASLPRAGDPNCTFLPLVDVIVAPSAGPKGHRDPRGGEVDGHGSRRPVDHATQILGRTPENSSVPDPGRLGAGRRCCVERQGRPDQVLRSTVRVLGWPEAARDDLEDAIERVSGDRVDLAGIALPYTVLGHVLPDQAEAARRRLEAAGAEVAVEEAWIGREQARDQPTRPSCPACGSAHTQPFGHAGPAARVNMTCTDCGHLFRDRRG
jgi:hypothetical protein